MKLSDKVDYDSVFNLELSVEEYMEQLDTLLKQNRVSIVERRKILRQKSQEFKDKMYRANADIRKR